MAPGLIRLLIPLALFLARPLDVAGQAATPPESNLGVRDIGIFSDLDDRVQIALPRGLDASHVNAILDQPRAQLVLYDGDWPLKVYPLPANGTALTLGSLRISLRPGDRAELLPLLAAERVRVQSQRAELPPGDVDDDGIPDPLDVLIGAHKTALNADRYDGRYVNIEYPLGDVPRAIGVCTDVVIRALRNAGIDLQRAIHEDITAAPRAYPSVKRANPSIDHRRVRGMLPYMQRHFESHSARLDLASDPLRPGDIVFMDTFPDRPGCEHVGIVSERYEDQGLPAIINNWTDGTVTRAMKLLSWVPVTDRFRVPRHASPIAPATTQLIVVQSESFETTRATLQRYERVLGQAWRAVGEPRAAVLGYGGYGWGDGLHGSGAPSGRAGPIKREGDGRSPAGAFALGMLRGYAAQAPAGAKLSYAASTSDQRCVDDASSELYNRIVPASAGSFRSAEHMKRDDDMYELAIDVEHNRAPITAGHGSCIFMHVWAGPDKPVTGCTGVAKGDMRMLAAWLEPGAVLVALPRSEYKALRAPWGLP
jgi:uncharacterized protein YijF (DUF1287 family)